jgi:hypothetical protein
LTPAKLYNALQRVRERREHCGDVRFCEEERLSPTSAAEFKLFGNDTNSLEKFTACADSDDISSFHESFVISSVLANCFRFAFIFFPTGRETQYMSAAELKATAASLRCRLDVSATTPVAEAFRAGRLALFAAKRILAYKEKRHFHLARALEQHFDDAPVPTDVAGQRVLKQVLEEHCYGAALELYNVRVNPLHARTHACTITVAACTRADTRPGGAVVRRGNGARRRELWQMGGQRLCNAGPHGIATPKRVFKTVFL